jgi:hypothetical protein
VTRRLRLAEGVLGRTKQVVIGAIPERPTVLVLLAQENGSAASTPSTGRA